MDTVQAAVWVENGSISFRCEGADSGSVDALAGSLNGESRSVPAIRLKNVLAEEPVDLLKLDIEGAEGSVLEDCLPELRQVRALLLDLHEFDPDRRETGRVTSMLTEAGFVYNVDSLIPLPWRAPYGRRRRAISRHAPLLGRARPGVASVEPPFRNREPGNRGLSPISDNWRPLWAS